MLVFRSPRGDLALGAGVAGASLTLDFDTGLGAEASTGSSEGGALTVMVLSLPCKSAHVRQVEQSHIPFQEGY